jgi:DIS3-like exonuclease 1
MLSSKIDEKIRIGWNKRRGQVSVLRERYLRDDISCHIQSCQSCKIHSVEGYVLGSDLDYYVVPDVKMLEDFYEVFEHHQIRGVILTQTGSKQAFNLTYSLENKYLFS